MNLPASFKRSPVRVISTGADPTREIAQLKARLRELERTPEDVARAEAKRYADALAEERRSAVLRLAHCETHDPDARELLPDPFSRQGADTRHELTWGQRAAQARAHLAEIDEELERVRASF